VSDAAPAAEPAKKRFSLRFRRRPRAPGQRRRLPFDLKKALFILPNAFTVSSIFCGVYAIMQATKPDATSVAFYQAAMAIFYAAFFDAFDGRVARLTKTQSDFGVQIDSLADVISFGVAPCILIYRWALFDLGLAGKLVAFTFCACGAIRLARFNVLAARGEGSPNFFVGLPIPGAAAMVVSLVIAQTRSLGVPVEAKGSVLALVLILSYLMISNVRYPTFKTYRPRLMHVPLYLVGAGLALATTLLFRVSVTLVGIIGCYIVYGLVAEVFFFRRRRIALEGPEPEPAAPADDGLAAKSS
jgi:CDP-diacylglycerol--serine O-phosphatidyltransferase